MQIIIVWNEVILGGGSQCIPVIHVLLKVQVLTPLNQTVHILLKLPIIYFHKLLIVEGILIQ